MSDFTELHRKARDFWLRITSAETFLARKKGKLKNYLILEEDGLTVMRVRAPKGMKHYYGQEKLLVVMGKTRIAKLIMNDAHRID